MDAINTDKLEPYHNAHANFLLMSIQMIACIDSLARTNMYRQGLKKALNDAIKELERTDLNKRLSELWNCDEKAVYHITDRYMNICTRLSTATPEMWSTFDCVVEMILKDHEYILHRLNIVHGDSSEIEQLEEREDLITEIIKLPIASMKQLKPFVQGLKNIYPS